MSTATGQRLRDVRIQLGWTQDDLAEALGCPQSMLSRWENNTRPLTVDNLILIAAAMGVAPAMLLPESELPIRRDPVLSAAAVVTQMRTCADLIEASYTEPSSTTDNAPTTSSVPL